MKKEKKRDYYNITFKILSIIFTIICSMTLSMFSYYLLKVNIIPAKYLYIGYGILLLIILLILYIIYKKKNYFLRGLGLLIIGLLSIGFIYANGYLENTYKFLKATQIGNYESITFSVVVNKNSNYNKLNDVKNQNIAYLEDEYKSEVAKEIKKQIKYNEIIANKIQELSDMIETNTVEAIVLDNSYYELMKELKKSFDETTKVIETFEIQIKTHKEESNITMNEDPYILYISGIDRYGNVNSVRGRSDVNQIIVVNPKTSHILLVNTPRDYYIQLHGTTGLKDKLTHAGIYGIEKSITTLEDLYSIDINYYLRVNFNSLIKIVDVIGDIEVYSDKDLVLSNDKSYHVKVGMNKMNGKQALAYARERYGYVTGDNHRGLNQQEVIKAIINKITSSKVLISKYNTILSNLSGTFQTDMPIDKITSFIRYQLNEMPNWKIENMAVTGYNSSNFTYSMGTKYKLYVMEPDWNSVEKAKEKINEVLNEN